MPNYLRNCTPGWHNEGMTKTEDTRPEDYREHAAQFTALTAVTPAVTQTAAQAFQAAMWTFTLVDQDA